MPQTAKLLKPKQPVGDFSEGRGPSPEQQLANLRAVLPGPGSFEEETNATPENAGDTLGRLVAQLRLAEQRVEQAEAELRERVKERDRIAMTDIPDAMAALGGLTSFKMEDGCTVAIKEDIKISTNEDTRPVVHEWLREHGHSGIIKAQLVIGATELTEVQQAKLAALALKFGADAERKDSVHHQTLLALCRELMEAGQPTPEGVNVFPYKLAQIKEPKARSKG